MNMNLFVTAITPGIALGLALYFFDRYDREPLKLLIKVFLGGIIVVIPTIIVEEAMSYANIFPGIYGTAFTAFIATGFTEEYMKRAAVIKTAYNKPAFNEKLDGIIYCAFSALGFATIENIIYVVFAFADVESIGFYRAILSVPAHMLFAVTMGYYLSLSKFANTPEASRHYYKKSLVIPAALHGIYDFILMSQNGFLLLLFIPFIIYLWVVNLKKLNIYYKESKLISETRNMNIFNDYNDNDYEGK